MGTGGGMDVCWRDVAARVLRMSLAFLLVFSTTFWAQSKLAEDAFAQQGQTAQTAQVVQGARMSAQVAQAMRQGEVAQAAQGSAQEAQEARMLALTDSGKKADKSEDAESPEAESPTAEDPSEESPSSEASDPGGECGESGNDEDDDLRIVDIGVFREGTTRDAFAFASERSQTSGSVRATIDEKGGSIDFDGAVWWGDGNVEYDSSKVSWRMAAGDEAIARLSPSGILEANGTDDGTVTVIAYVDGEYTESGEELVAEFLVELRGQTDAKYVKSITICDDTGAALDAGYRFEPGTLSTAMLELQARVIVHDPATDDDIEYLVTPSSGLSTQSGGELADLTWESADTRLGTVSDEGIYRPTVAATNVVYCASTAGFNGSRVQAQATIDMPPSNGKEAANGYHPQSTLTVKVYYENYPDQMVGETVFSLEDLEDLGTVTQTYTALRGKEGYMTTTGRGPLLAKVLKAAGVNTDGIARLRFGTPDNYQGVVSWDLLVDTERYYFPNIDIGQYTEAVQVAPMIAIDAYRNVGSDVSVHTDDMTDTRRFLLLFGAKPTGESTTNLQVYNIHTLYVELEGSPPAKGGSEVIVKFVDSITGEVLKTEATSSPDSVKAPNAPDHDGYTFKGWNKSTDKAGNVTYTTVYESDNSKSSGSSENSGSSSGGSGGKSNGSNTNNGENGGGNGGTVPNNNGGDDNGGKGTHDLVDPNQGGAAKGNAGATSNAQAEPLQMQSSDATVTQLDPNSVQTISQGRWSALQAINKHPSNVDDLMLNNPFAPYAAPFFAGAFAAGGLEAGLAFFRQKRVPRGLRKAAAS